MARITPLIFLSSTKRDLHQHREAVQRKLLSLDVLYRGMEFFGARPSLPRDVILDELIRCDLYIGIIGQRYGSRDPAACCPYTELEYRKSQSANKPALIFLMHKDHALKHDDQEATEDGREKLINFRRLLEANHVVEEFDSPGDLAGKVYFSVKAWLDQSSPKLARLYCEPLNERHGNYVRKLHSRNLPEVLDALQKLGSVNSRMGNEHIYAALHRADLPAEYFKEAVLRLIHMQDEERLSEMLVNLAEDTPSRKYLILLAIGHRAMLECRRLTEREVRCVLGSEHAAEESLRIEVAHALGKILPLGVMNNACLQALQRLGQDSSLEVRKKVSDALHHSGKPILDFSLGNT